ncbi:glyoxylate/hydroxypyruvate reductase A [Amphritea sp. 1_MG-2023]|uniref:2-hydroxyacid dehydrogenase n=1 Tax=Amphritea sp. 1_MG-2023 TaxID=3062670 RepID=UPI0026E12B3E|nr:glyoxylate/hydroxypyruvate reductase A [Amphritea sp. 1_MG-2023]MDO6565001.1 glyoxylate/hydroxypyruvate reductase A [Amphritea sp. 1_MG-2023]
MRPIIPFVHQLPQHEVQQWCDSLGELLPGCDIRPFVQLSEAEKALASVAVVANPAPADVAQLPHLQWVHSVWAGVEGMMASLAHMPFEIVRLTDPHLAKTMAEAVLAWSLYLHRGMPQYRQQQSASQWQPQPYCDAHERHIVVLGLGLLGQQSALRLVDNGFRVSGWSRSEKHLDGVACYAGESALIDLIAQADIIVNLLPLTPSTQGLMDQAFFQQLKAGASLINFGRGATLIEADLLAALDQGQLTHAVLDVFDQEPLPETSALWRHSGITVLPHISAPTSVTTASRIVADNIQRYLTQATIPPSVDKSQGY